jgi:hypothetical protein
MEDCLSRGKMGGVLEETGMWRETNPENMCAPLFIKFPPQSQAHGQKKTMPEVLPEGCSPEKPLAKKMVRVTSPKKLSQFESSG